MAKAKYENAAKMNFEAPLTTLVWLTSFVSVVLTYVFRSCSSPISQAIRSLWWKLAHDNYLRNTWPARYP